MDKIVKLVVCGCLCLLFGVNVRAEEVETVPIKKGDVLLESSDYSEIRKLETEMLEDLEDLYEGSEVLNPDIPEKIDFSKAVKVYIDTGIEQLNTDKQSDIVECLEKSTYVWVIPMEISGENAEITVAKGLPLNKENAYMLTEKEKKEIEEQEGKWMITETARLVTDAYVDQIHENRSIQKNAEEVVFVGAIPGMRYPVAVGFRNGKAEDMYSLGFTYQIVEAIREKSDKRLKKGIGNLKYDYETIINLSNNYEINENDMSGGAGGELAIGEKSYESFYIIVFSVIIVSVFAAIFCVYLQLPNRKK